MSRGEPRQGDPAETHEGDGARPPFEVVVVGNAGIDTNVFGAGGESANRESDFTENLDTVGQAGGFSSRAWAQLGRRVAFIGSLGDDPLGHWIRRDLSADGVDLSAVFTDPTGTARSVNLMAPDGTRRCYYDGKAHLRIAPDLGACGKLLAGARLVHVHLPNWARLLLPLARELNVPVACDLQDVHDPADPYRADFVAGADALFFSAVNLRDVEATVDALFARGPAQVIVVGLGAGGCLVASRRERRRYGPVSLAQPVVDTNGAGDCLAVGFLDGWALEGLPIDRAILRGQIAARWACGVKGRSDRLIDRATLLSIEQERAP